MQKYPADKKYQIFFLCTTIGMIAFAFIHSLMPAEVSSDESGIVLTILRDIFATLHIPTKPLNSYILRKFAHYLEYVMIGMSMVCYTIAHDVKRPLHYLFTALFFGLLTPVIDETIQLYTPGRSGQVSDVCLDFLGILTGFMTVLLIFFVIRQLRQKTTRTK